MSCYATSTGPASPVRRLADRNGQVYQLNSGGTDDGTAIAWRFQTRWIELSSGLPRVGVADPVQGRGSGT
jgi:hypothetical protein